jgi:TonB family protein
MRRGQLFLALMLACGCLFAQKTSNSKPRQVQGRPEQNSSVHEQVKSDAASESAESKDNPCITSGEKAAVVTQQQLRGKLIERVPPVYPKKARQAGVQGTVVLCVVIGTDGKVKSLKPISGPRELVGAAMKAVNKWRYTPFVLNNENVEVVTDIRVNFQLSPD